MKKKPIYSTKSLIMPNRILSILILIIIIVLLILITLRYQSTQTDTNENTTFPIQKSDKEWKNILSPEAYNVLRKQGTEPAFTGTYTDHKKDGQYHCKACKAPLFESDKKYNSGTGWPSFTEAISQFIGTKEDLKFGMRRTEVHCNQCGSHLGHVFPDGPGENGQRYCINSISLTFEPSQSKDAKK